MLIKENFKKLPSYIRRQGTRKRFCFVVPSDVLFFISEVLYFTLFQALSMFSDLRQFEYAKVCRHVRIEDLH